MASTRSVRSVESSFYTASSSPGSTGELSSVINLNGKSYHLTVHHKKPGSDWEEITQSYLEQAKGINLQEALQKHINSKYKNVKNIEITTSIDLKAGSICTVKDTDGIVRKVPEFSLTASQNDKIFAVLKKIETPRCILDSSSLSEESLKTLNSSSIKISLEEKVNRYLDQATEFSVPSEDLEKYEQNNEEVLNGKKPRLEFFKEPTLIDHERAIGLDRLGNNCCINAALQIILTNPNLRELWKLHFKEPADIYYKALNEGKSSAPKEVTQRFRELLAEKSRLVNKESTQQEASYVLEAFFDICQKDGLNLSSTMLSSKREKYNVTGGVRELDRTNTHETFLMPIIVDQSTPETRLEELIKKNCNSITEAEGKKFEYTTKYTDLPTSLIVHFSHYGKASSVIPMDFTFPKECIEDRSTHEYVLEAFAVHLGSTHESGHFIAYRKVNGQWKKFNDNQVTNVDESQVQLLLGRSQQQSTSFIGRLLRSRGPLFPGSNPYVCMLSYSKKPS